MSSESQSEVSSTLAPAAAGDTVPAQLDQGSRESKCAPTLTANEVSAWAVADEAETLAYTLSLVERNLDRAKRQHEAATEELQSLINVTIGTELPQSVENLQSAAVGLEAVFARIDTIEKHLDQLNRIIREIHTAVSSIETKGDLKEKTASLFHSLGFKAAANAATTGLWSRVPLHAMINRQTTQEFLAAAQPVFDFFLVESK